MGADAFRYDGKRALVVGGATGIGRATAELLLDLGAELVVMDYAAVDLDGAKEIQLDLRNKESIDGALDECGGPIDALFACAGVADGFEQIERVNFIGHRHLIQTAIAKGYVGSGGAIGTISSAAGLGWEAQLDVINTLLDTPDWDSAVAWFDSQENVKHYLFTKRAMAQYVAREALAMSKLGIRINGIMPGPTDTPLAQANKEMWLDFGSDFRAEAGVAAATPADQAHPLAFLCSDAAAYINGQLLIVDAGWYSAGLSGAYPAITETVKFLAGRYG